VFHSVPFPLRHLLPTIKNRWIVLIHGMGMTEKSWIDPYAESMAGGALPFDYVLTDLDHPPDSCGLNRGLFHSFCPSTALRLLPSRPLPLWGVLSKSGWGLVTWTQRDSLGPLGVAVDELKRIMECFSSGDRVVFLGHSRGGLIARKFLQERAPGWEKVKAAILLGSPNRGSGIAELTRKTRPLFMFPGFGRMASFVNRGIAGRILENVINYLQDSLGKSAIQELCPGSPLMAAMKSGEQEESRHGIPYFNFAGTSTTYVRLYRILNREPLRTVQAFSLFDGMENFIWGFGPSELQQGRGDGMVSAEKAFLPFARENQRVPINHAQFLIDAEIRKKILDILKIFLE
jgi:pimeloyl-ACP methyl ester carboxylesterase